MQISDFIEVDEIIVDPYTSIQSIEHDLLQKEYVVIKERNRFIGILTAVSYTHLTLPTIYSV